MIAKGLRILWRNLATIITALVLAVTVWVSAVVAADPNEERIFPESIPLEVTNIPEDMILVGQIPSSVQATLSAPRSLWEQLLVDIDLIHAKVDLSGKVPGQYRLPVELEIALQPVRVISIVPEEVGLILEERLLVEKDIQVNLIGEPALGYELLRSTISRKKVKIEGPQSIVSQVNKVVVNLEITNARETIVKELVLRALDENEQQVTGITLDPEKVIVTQEFLQSGGYRDLAVLVETTGRVASGYRVANISAEPLTVTVFSSEPEVVAGMPGFIQTEPLDLSGAKEPIDENLLLNLPEGVILVSEKQTVHVRVDVAVIESSLSMQIKVEPVGLSSEQVAQISPIELGVIVSGPIPVLDVLNPKDIVIIVELSDLEPGTYLLQPEVVSLPEGVVIESIIPETIEVIITVGEPTQTPTPSVSP